MNRADSLPGKVLPPDELDGPLALLTGTRPGIIKFSPLFRELDRRAIPYIMIHSGQHYSPEMDGVFFRELELRAPDYKLDVVRHFPLHGEQTAEMLRGIERILIERRPAVLVVGGDCNTHLAGALAARKLHVPVAHIEAGMRSHDWRMPEEHNRVLIDHISELLFVHAESAAENLRRDGVRGRVFVVGTTIADAVLQNLALARSKSDILDRLGLRQDGYLAATCHREENVDSEDSLRDILEALEAAGAKHRKPVILPAHPRTTKQVLRFGLRERVDGMRFLRLIEPLGYLDFLMLLAHARLFFTDSGGGQQEACILKVPCITLRPSTEWVETVAVGANLVVGTSKERILEAADRLVDSAPEWDNPFGDGRSAERIVDILGWALHAGVPSPATNAAL